MSGAARRWPAIATRLLRRAPAALAGLLFDAAVDSLELGKRAMAWLAHVANARTVAIAAVIAVVAGGAALYRYRRGAVPAASQTQDLAHLDVAQPLLSDGACANRPSSPPPC
jgi:hypothetical protein